MLSVMNAHRATLSAPLSATLPQNVRKQFADDAVMLCVPTGKGATGVRAIEEFVKNMSSQAHIIESEEVVSSVRGEKALVEETVLTLNHSTALDWLLPGVRPTNKCIVVAMVTVVTFAADGRIAAKRMHWDQASVLRQAAVLPRSLYCKANASEVQLPILGADIAAPLVAAAAANRIEMAKAPEAFDEKPMPATPSSNRRRDPAAGIVPQGDEPAVRPSPARQTSDVFGLAAPSAAQGHAATSIRTSSSLSYVLGGDSDNNLSSSSSLQPQNAQHHQSRPSSRVTQPAGGRSSNIFSDDPAPLRTAVPIDPRRYVTQISFSGEAEAARAEDDSARTVMTGRRTYADHNNKSQFSFGDDGSDNVNTNAAANKIAAHAGAMSGNNNSDTVSVTSQSDSLAAGINAGSAQEHQLGHGRRTFPGRDNRSHFTFSDQQDPAYVQDNTAVHTGRKMTANSNASHFSFGNGEDYNSNTDQDNKPTVPRHINRRNPNAESGEASVRPSSRVLRAPGGGSTFSFA